MISLDTILEIENSLRNLDEEETKRLLRRFERKQTPIFVYLAAVSEREELNEDEQDILFTVAIVLWMTLVESSRPPKKVKMKRIDELDNEIMSMMEDLESNESPMEMKARQLISQQEPRMSEYIILRCTQSDGQTPAREEVRSFLVLFLMVVLNGLLETSMS